MILDNHTEGCPGDDCEREGCADLPENQDPPHPHWCRPLGGQHMTGCPWRMPIIPTHEPYGRKR